MKGREQATFGEFLLNFWKLLRTRRCDASLNRCGDTANLVGTRSKLSPDLPIHVRDIAESLASRHLANVHQLKANAVRISKRGLFRSFRMIGK
jgi:hypothetical protein